LQKQKEIYTLTTLATPINPISKYDIDGYDYNYALKDYWDSLNWKVKDPKDYCTVHTKQFKCTIPRTKLSSL